MAGVAMIFREYWEQRKLIPTGVWLMLIAYSLVAFGSPMPPKITGLEIVMGCGLLMGGILLTGLVIRKIQQEKSAQWCLGLTALLFLIPLFVGLLRGNALSDITRDIFPFAFLLLIPIFLTYSTSSDNRAALRTLVVMVLVFVGICTAVTFFVGLHNLFGSIDDMVLGMRKGIAQYDITQATQATQATASAIEIQRALFLKPFDSAMLFSAIFLSAWGVVLMARSWRGWLPGMLLAGIGAFIAYGFMILGLRAYTALFVLAIAAVCLTQLRERGLYIRLLPVFVLICILFWSQIEPILQLLWMKQKLVGANGKVGEWLAVTTTIAATPQSTLLGIGWGGTFVNPIYGADSRFTHSMLSFYLLKSGAIGLGMLLTIIGLLLAYSQKIGDRVHMDTSRLILLISCLPPLLIGVLFEPTYKMLSYGVVLALLNLTLPVCMRSKNDRVG